MSVAPISTSYRPWANRMIAVEPGNRIVGNIAAATPVPCHQPSTSCARGSVGRDAHPNRSAPRRRHATRLREENGSPDSGCTSGSLRTRSSIGSMSSATASSSTAHSSPKLPGASPGARM